MAVPRWAGPPTEGQERGHRRPVYEVRVEQARIREQCARQRRHAAEMRRWAASIREQSADLKQRR